MPLASRDFADAELGFLEFVHQHRTGFAARVMPEAAPRPRRASPACGKRPIISCKYGSRVDMDQQERLVGAAEGSETPMNRERKSLCQN